MIAYITLNSKSTPNSENQLRQAYRHIEPRSRWNEQPMAVNAKAADSPATCTARGERLSKLWGILPGTEKNPPFLRALPR